MTVAAGSSLPDDAVLDGPVWIGADVRIGAGVRLTGPVVLGDGASVGDGAQLRSSIVFPGTQISPDSILIDAIAGHKGILQSLRRAAEALPSAGEAFERRRRRTPVAAVLHPI